MLDKKFQKQTLIDLLKKQGEPVSLNHLLKILGPDYAERTVRRWLNKLVVEGFVVRTGKKRGTRYSLFISGAKQLVEFNIEKSRAINFVNQPIYKRNPTTYKLEWLESYQPNETYYLSEYDRTQMYQNGKRGIEKDAAGTYFRKIYNRLLIDLSYNSSRLEGNTYSILDTEKLILEGKSAQGKLDEETIMILNHKEAIRYLVDTARGREIQYNEICTLHYLLSDGLVPKQYSGNVRDHGVRINATTYVPLENKNQLENILKIICQKSEQIQNPYEQSFFLLTHIAYLQPFIDVNKRTSRLSANIPLVRHNLVPLSFNDIKQQDYISAMLCVYELNDVQPLLELYRFSYLLSCKRYDVAIDDIGYNEIHVRYRNERREMLRHVISQSLVENNLRDYLNLQIETLIPENDRKEFENDLIEELNEINEHRIAGLGITTEQLQHWLKLYRPIRQ